MRPRGVTAPRLARQCATVVVSTPNRAANSRTDLRIASCSAAASNPVHSRPLTIPPPETKRFEPTATTVRQHHANVRPYAPKVLGGKVKAAPGSERRRVTSA